MKSPRQDVQYRMLSWVFFENMIFIIMQILTYLDKLLTFQYLQIYLDLDFADKEFSELLDLPMVKYGLDIDELVYNHMQKYPVSINKLTSNMSKSYVVGRHSDKFINTRFI